MNTANLSERQKLILGLVVQDYVERAKPVGSSHLVKAFGLEVSPATVRNEMAALADAGFLSQPHTSAGRVPTERGYRFFVGELMQRVDLPSATKHTISHQFYQARHEMGQWMKLAASVLASQSRAASLVTTPQAQRARFKHVELILTSGRQVLMVLVLEDGRVIQQMLVMKEPLTQEQLSHSSNEINALFGGRTLAALNDSPADLSALAGDVLELIRRELEDEHDRLSGEVYHDGWTNVLAEPEFSATDAAQRALRVLEERPLLEDLLTQTMMQSEIGGVQVLIGGEGRWEELNDFSLVLARYGSAESASGFLGVMGPMRMPYGRVVSTVDYVAGLLGDILAESMSAAD
jgi:heat-inducible transcriptional repressor